ncbi:MAG: hypothetical protein MUE69_28530 [Myxococcota bacterium]|nr:hypothetical protein [Myxococcota bacterium]
MIGHRNDDRLPRGEPIAVQARSVGRSEVHEHDFVSRFVETKHGVPLRDHGVIDRNLVQRIPTDADRRPEKAESLNVAVAMIDSND